MTIIVAMTMGLVEGLKSVIDLGKWKMIASMIIGGTLYALSAYAGWVGHDILMMLMAGLTASGLYSGTKALRK